MGRKKHPQRFKQTPNAKGPSSLIDKLAGEAPTTLDAHMRSPYASLFVCLLLALAVVAVFGQTANFNFVNYDDDQYLYANTHVAKGLTPSNVIWAFTSFDASNWHPVTWISHITDCQLYGLNPGKHHLTNVFIHAFTSILLFLLLRQMTGRFWPSALVAFLFAIHPLRVESVAWISERKDLLCGLFFMLTLMAYVGYARNAFSWLRYAAVILLFSLGLMSKPMIVTLPFVLLLLDYWPLGRTSFSPQDGLKQTAKRLIVEKIPLFVLSAASCGVTVIAQKKVIERAADITVYDRFANAAVSYLIYVQKMVWPTDLAALYPYKKGGFSLLAFAAAVGVLVAATYFALALRKKYPWLAVGWFWYLGMLIPVIGLVQVGSQSMADRYSYLPQIGLYVVIASFSAELIRRRPALTKPVAASCFAALIIFAAVAFRQTSFWSDSETLWNHVIACTENNSIAYNNLGTVCLKSNRTATAIEYYRKALKLDPDYLRTRFNLGISLAEMGQYDDGMKELYAVLKRDPNYASAYIMIGSCLAKKGQLQEAIKNYEEGLRITPNNFDARIRLGAACEEMGRLDEAIGCFHKAIELNPRYLDGYLKYISACEKAGRAAEVVPVARKALALARDENRRDSAQALGNWLAQHDAVLLKSPDLFAPSGTSLPR